MPAIDLREGRVVRLRQGDYGRQTTYAADPRELAERHAAAGARWLHVVDLDGARSGRLDNLAAVEAIAGAGIAVQAGGGVRDEAGVRRLFDAGAARVVVGSLAVHDAARVAGWMDRFGPERFTIALDTRLLDGRWVLPSAGWTEVGERVLGELVPWYERRGARHLLCTDIERDGMLGGINAGLYRLLADTAPALAVQASGGVGALDDIRAARAAGAQAVVLGRALLEGRFSLAEALAC